MNTYQTSTLAQPDVRFASFWRRVAASMLDGLVIGIAVSVLSGLIPADNAVGTGLIAPIVFFLGPWVYVVSLPATGATLGKQMVGIRVVDGDGSPPGLRRATRRTFLPFLLSVAPTVVLVSALMIDTNLMTGLLVFVAASLVAFAFWWIDVLWMLGNDRRQTLHDRLGGTMVVRHMSAGLESGLPAEHAR